MPQKTNKSIDDVTVTLHEGTGLMKLNDSDPTIGKMVRMADEKRSLYDQYVAENKPAALTIINDVGNAIIAVGYKKDSDQGDLNISVIKGPSGNIYNLKENIKVEFDKETNVQEGKIKGAITNESFKSLKNSLIKIMGHEDSMAVFKAMGAEVKHEKLEVAHVDTHSSPLSTPKGKPTQIKTGQNHSV